MKKTARTIFAIDLGTQSLRLSAYSSDGECVWAWSAPVSSQVRGATYTQAPAEWAEALHTALYEASRAGLQPEAIAAAGPLAGWVPLDSAGRPLAPAVMYLDGRAATEVEAVCRALAHAGSQRPSFRVTVADPLPNLLRLRREAPEIAAKTAALLDATGWLNMFLTGERTLNPYTALRLYTQPVREALRLEESFFGRVVPVGVEIGKLKAGLAQKYGFRQAPVVSAPFDSKCAYIAAGLSHAGDALDISGTVTSVGVRHASEVYDPQQRIYSVPLAEGWLVRGSTACAGSAIAWAEKHLLHMDIQAWTTQAASEPAGARGITFLPYLAGERTPYWNPHARAALLGVGLDTTGATIGRAVLESLAFSLRHILDCMSECGVKPASICLSGGLAKNDLLAQIKADVTGVPIRRLANRELTSLGLVAICCVSRGWAKDFLDAASRFVAVERDFMPQPENAAVYENAYRRYRRYGEALLPTFRGDGIF